MSLFTRIQDLVDKLSRWLGFLPPLAARLTLGHVFFWSGWGKLHEPPVDFFTQLGIPAPAIMAMFIACVEFGGGILLVAGLLTRLAALMLASTMAVALLTAFHGKIDDFGALTGISEYLYLLLLVWLVIAGAGALSVDAVLAWRLRRRTP